MFKFTFRKSGAKCLNLLLEKVDVGKGGKYSKRHKKYKKIKMHKTKRNKKYNTKKKRK